MDIRYFFKLTKLFSFSIVLYLIFLIARFQGLQPAMEGELGDFITALNFLFGSFVAYFMFVLNPKKDSRYLKNSLWWWLVSLLLITLAMDELFMLHEQVGVALGLKDTFVFLAYGAILGILLLLRVQEVFVKDTFIFLAIFAILSITSQLADYLYNEGTFMILGRDISYEQLLESFGALSLSCAITSMALRQLYTER